MRDDADFLIDSSDQPSALFEPMMVSIDNFDLDARPRELVLVKIACDRPDAPLQGQIESE